MKRLILNDKISISSKQLKELQWYVQERCELKLKVTKKTRFQSLSLENTNLEKVTAFTKFWSKRKLSENSES